MTNLREAGWIRITDLGAPAGLYPAEWCLPRLDDTKWWALEDARTIQRGIDATGEMPRVEDLEDAGHEWWKIFRQADDEGTGVVQRDGWLELGTGDFIGWRHMPPGPDFNRGQFGVLRRGEEERAISIAEADLEELRGRAQFIEEWIADIKEHGSADQRAARSEEGSTG